MKSIFDQAVRDELIMRIQSLSKDHTARWGKMNIYQMISHCILWDGWILGNTNLKYKQEFLGKLFGKMALRSSVKDDKPIGKNMPAGRAFIIKEQNGNVELQKKIWVERIAAYEHFSNPDFIHDFFGKMTKEQIGIFAYKHSDHHLRQFNA
ncbi:MAG: DUF1569 domain-containing protein [Bacteroidota bacterium]